MRLLVRDETGRVVRECFPSYFHSERTGARFEIHALPTGVYLLEVQALGYCRAVRDDLRVEAACVTDVGIVRLLRAKKRRHRILAERVTPLRWGMGVA